MKNTYAIQKMYYLKDPKTYWEIVAYNEDYKDGQCCGVYKTKKEAQEQLNITKMHQKLQNESIKTKNYIINKCLNLVYPGIVLNLYVIHDKDSNIIFESHDIKEIYKKINELKE
jgi:hypothetical protein